MNAGTLIWQQKSGKEPLRTPFNENENAMTNEDGYLKHPSMRRSIMKAKTDISSLLDAQEMPESISPVPCALSDLSNTLNDRLFINTIRSKVEVTYDCAFIHSNIARESQHNQPWKSPIDPRDTGPKVEHRFRSRQMHSTRHYSTKNQDSLGSFDWETVENERQVHEI